MSVIQYRLPIATDGDGVAQATVRGAGGILLGVLVEMGTIAEMDVEITDEPLGTTLLALVDQDADGAFQPMVAAADPADGTPLAGAFAAPTISGRLEVAVSGATADSQGEITLTIER